MSGLIRNIVLSAPDGRWAGNRWEGGQRALAQFYADLLEWNVIREDWPVVAPDEQALPRLAFGDGPTPEFRAPELDDPDRPPQIRLDLPTRSLAAAEERLTGLGATTLRRGPRSSIYADPFGHPLCIYLDDQDHGVAGSAPARVGRVTIDCFSPRALASFYMALLGLGRRPEDSPELVVLQPADERQPEMGFRHSVHAAPRWPDPSYPQQVHLDLLFEDVAGARQAAEKAGAIRLRDMGGSCVVYGDPAGHPFCLCGPGQ